MGKRLLVVWMKPNILKKLMNTDIILMDYLPEVARFADLRGKCVLEIGCGMGADAYQFAKNGAIYTGIDLTSEAVKTTQRRFSLFHVPGRIRVMNAEELEFPDNSFDHVYSFGVIHHSPHSEKIVKEIYRVLRKGGTTTVMLYNKQSINYYIEIMFLRKILRYFLLLRGSPSFIAMLTGFDRTKLERHREILLEHQNITKMQWISMNTDGPDCPLARVYSKSDCESLFNMFSLVDTKVYFFDKSHWSFLSKFIPKSSEFLGRTWGWHRIVFGQKL